jgi:hypothetical protein
VKLKGGDSLVKITFSTFVKAVSMLFGTVIARIRLEIERI